MAMMPSLPSIKSFDESKVKRIKGKFASKPGLVKPPVMKKLGGSVKGTLEYHAQRVRLHSARARAHAINFRAATTDAEKQKHSLALSASLKYARMEANKIKKMTGGAGDAHLGAQKHLSYAEQHAKSISSHVPKATPAAIASVATATGQTVKSATPSSGKIKSPSHGLTRVKYNVEQYHAHKKKAEAATSDAERKKYELAAELAKKRAHEFHAELTTMTGGAGKHHAKAGELLKTTGDSGIAVKAVPKTEDLTGKTIYNKLDKTTDVVTGMVKGGVKTEKSGILADDEFEVRKPTKKERMAKLDEKLAKMKAQEHADDDVAWQTRVQAGHLTPKEMGGKFEAERKKYTGMLDSKEKSAILAYSGSAYGDINTALRKDNGLGASMSSYSKSYVEGIDSGLKKYRVEHDTVVYRGAGSSAEAMKAIVARKPGDVWTEHAYTSTSVESASAFGGGIKLNITVPKGARAAPIPSNHPHEKELLLPRGSKMRVDKIEVEWSEGKHIVDRSEASMMQSRDAQLTSMKSAAKAKWGSKFDESKWDGGSQMSIDSFRQRWNTPKSVVVHATVVEQPH